MRSHIPLGRVFGIRIGLHYSWFLIAFLISFSLFAQFHAVYPGWPTRVSVLLAAVTAVLFFVSLLLHELSHALMAIARGLTVREITLFALDFAHGQPPKSRCSRLAEFRKSKANRPTRKPSFGSLWSVPPQAP